MPRVTGSKTTRSSKKKIAEPDFSGMPTLHLRSLFLGIVVIVIMGFIAAILNADNLADTLLNKKIDISTEGTINIPIDFSTAGSAISSPNLNLFNLKSGAKVTDGFVLVGEARLWYFEGDFPVSVADDNGNVIFRGPASAQEEWMTDQFVPFQVTLDFDKSPETKKGKLILQKDNPSGLMENDEVVEVPIRFE